MKVFTFKPVQETIAEQMRLLVGDLNPKAQMRRCFRCGEGFRPKNRYHVSCGKICSRSLHYIKFNLRRDLGEKAFPEWVKPKVDAKTKKLLRKQA